MPHVRDRIVQLFEEHFGSAPLEIRGLAADGSSRTYYRLLGPARETAIGALGLNPAENRAFLSFSRALRSAGLNVPAIYEVDETAGVWLAEDLGDTTLLSTLEEARQRTGEAFPSDVEAVFGLVLSNLPHFQIEGGRVVDFGAAYPRAEFDEQSILWDLNYFKYHFLQLAQVAFNEGRLEEDFHTLADFAVEADSRHFLHRDFQSRNVMLRGEEPWFIDYQGGRRGPLQYDVASLLYSATTGIPPGPRERLLEGYLDTLEAEHPVDRARWREHYRGFVLIRLMQAMGAYGYRGFFQRRPRFRQGVPKAARNLAYLLEEGLPLELPELESAFERIVERWGSATSGPDTRAPGDRDADSDLAIRLSSFSYKHGYPDEGSQHGGGFVFDCRALPNPGREERYHALSGLDRPVVERLESQAEIEPFWQNTRSLVEAQVENYLHRGFRSLTIAFGCTGGQHRSVYFAERMARHLGARFPHVDVHVTHLERSSWPQRTGEGDWTP